MELPYNYAQLKYSSQRWYVEYYCVNPNNGVKTRIRKKIKDYHSAQLIQREGSRLVDTINAKLDAGWNPFAIRHSTKIYLPLTEALDFVLKLRSREVEASSMKNYRQRVRNLKEWLQSKKIGNLRCFEFTASIALEYMNHVILNQDITNRTWNCYLIDYKGFFNTLIDNEYFANNPFKPLKKKKAAEKTKNPWTVEQQAKYAKHLKEFDYDFYIVSMYCYYFALRNKETCLLKVKDVKFYKQYIDVSAEIAKNDRQRLLPIPEIFREELQHYLKDVPGDWYLCSFGFKPGPLPMRPSEISRHFRTIADALGFDSSVQYYGLKDTCAEMLIRSGVHAKTIQKLFDHSSLKTTDAYMSKISEPQLEDLRDHFPEFAVQIQHQ
jgi:site-specific recombinase XerD